MFTRQMYGRAGFALRRARVLPYASLPTKEHNAACRRLALEEAVSP